MRGRKARGRRVTDGEAEALLERLVSIPSPSGQEAEAAAFLADWLAGHGFEASVDESGSPVGVRGQGPRQIVLLGHIDTVPGQIPVRREGRRLYGRGTVDAKGPLAAFAVAAARVRVPPGCTLVIVGATEEEAPSSRGARAALRRWRPAACLVGEPSNWDRVTLGYKGRLNLTWRWRGPLAHSASPVPTPAERALQAWRAIESWTAQVNHGRERTFDRLDATLMSLNTRTRGYQGQATLRAVFRLPPDLAPAWVETALRARLTTGSVECNGHTPAYVAAKNTSVARALLAAIRQQGGRPRFVYKSGTSDMNLAGPAWGCPIAAYGPGDSRLDHTPEEHLDLNEYLRAIRVLEGALARLLEADDPPASANVPGRSI